MRGTSLSAETKSVNGADDAVARMMAPAVAAGEIDLSVGEPDQALPAELVEAAVASLRAGRTQYTPKLGLAELREAIAQDVERGTGYRPDVDDVVVTMGGTGAVAVAVAAVCVPGGSIMVPDPAWPNYRVLAERLGIEVLSYPQGPSGDAMIDLAAVEAGLRAGVRLVVVNSPSNPTGALASAQLLARLVELVRAHDAYILSDEAYEAIVFAGGRAPSPLGVGGQDVTLSARTFSKTYSMTGLRAGALISPPQFRVAVAALHGTTAGCAPITAQLVGIEALRSLPDRGAELAAAYRSRLDLALSLLGRWAPVSSPQELGGFYLWLDARPTGRSSRQVSAALRERGVVVSAGTVYTDTDGFVRLALTAQEPALRQALTDVRAVLDELADSATTD